MSPARWAPTHEALRIKHKQYFTQPIFLLTNLQTNSIHEKDVAMKTSIVLLPYAITLDDRKVGHAREYFPAQKRNATVTANPRNMR